MKKFLKYIAKIPIFAYAAQVAFYFLLSLFPFLFLVTKIAAFFSISSDNILSTIYFIFPQVTYDVIYQNLYTLTAYTNVYSIGFYILIAIWSSSMLINSLKRIFSIDIGLNPANQIILRRIVSIIFTVLVAFIIIFSLFTTLLANIVINFLTSYIYIKNLANIITFLTIFIIAVVDFTLIYKFIPTIPIRFGEALPGALFTTIGYVLTSYVFSYYITYVTDYSKLYGALGSVTLLTLWLYISSTIIILGGHVNTFLIKNRKNLL